MSKVLYNLRWEGTSPSVEDICRKFGFTPEEIDRDYGVIEIDPADHLYCLMVDQSAVERLDRDWANQSEPSGLEGPFSNPRIEPFGPPQT